MGGAIIELAPKGNYTFKEVYLTTCEGENSLFEFSTKKAVLEDYTLVTAYDVKAKLFRLPVFWIPYMKKNLGSLEDSPIDYTIQTGGGDGFLFSMRYELYSWHDLKAFLEFDYWVKHGPGGAFQLEYLPKDYPLEFRCNNFIAWD